MVFHIATSEAELEVLQLAFILSICVMIGFGNYLFFNGGLLTEGDKYTVWLRKHWFWVIPLVAYGIGLMGALAIVGSVQNT